MSDNSDINRLTHQVQCLGIPFDAVVLDTLFTDFKIRNIWELLDANYRWMINQHPYLQQWCQTERPGELIYQALLSRVHGVFQDEVLRAANGDPNDYNQLVNHFQPLERPVLQT